MSDDLDAAILRILGDAPSPVKAWEIASLLKKERFPGFTSSNKTSTTMVNRRLYGALRSKLTQEADYRWSLHARAKAPPPVEPPESKTPPRPPASHPGVAAPETAALSAQGLVSTTGGLDALRIHAEDFRDALQDLDIDGQVEALAAVFDVYFAQFADPDRPPRELVGELNKMLGRTCHLTVRNDVLEQALALVDGVTRTASGLTVELRRAGTSATWTLELAGRTLGTAILEPSASTSPPPNQSSSRPTAFTSPPPDPSPRPKEAPRTVPLPSVTSHRGLGTRRTASLSTPRPTATTEGIDTLRMHAADYRDALQDLDVGGQVEALAAALGVYFAQIAAPDRPPRELVGELNKILGKECHLTVRSDVLDQALAQVDGVTRTLTGLTVELKRAGTSATWTLELAGRTLGTAILEPPAFKSGRPNQSASRPTAFSTPLTMSTQPLPEGSSAGSLRELRAGDVIRGRYRLDHLAGEGGMGQVWKAFPTNGGSSAVALKTFRRPTQSLRDALERELRILRSLRRSDLFPLVHDAIADGGRLFVAMDWVPGTDLQRHLEASPANLGTLGRGRFLDWMSQVTDRLSYLHAWHPRPIVFRDLKPSNVMVDTSGDQSLRLVDFGISHLLDPEAKDSVRRGTEGYIAPEVHRGQVDPRVDVFSMGRLALFLLFGHAEFHAVGRDSMPPGSAQRGLGLPMVRAALLLCHPNPSSRPSSALEAFELLRTARPGPSQRTKPGRSGPSCMGCEAELLREVESCPWCGRTKRDPSGDSSVRRPALVVKTTPPSAAPSRTTTWRNIRAWRRLVELRASADLSQLLCLGHIDVEPYDYQREAAIQILRTMHGRGLIADDVGLGKTIEAGLILKEYRLRGLVRKCLVVSPPALLSQLQGELREKFRMDFREFKTSGDKDGRQGTVGPAGLRRADLVIVSSNGLSRDATRTLFEQLKWDIVVVDECHHMRNHRAKLSRSVRSVSAQSDYRLFLSATPFSGKVDELWAIYNALDPGQLGASLDEFHRRFCVRRSGSVRRSGRYEPIAKKVREVTQRLTIRRRRQDLHIQFPGRTARRLPVSLGRYGALYKEFAAAVCGHTSNALVRHHLLQQFCSSFESLRGSSTFPMLPSGLRSRLSGLRDDDHPKVRRLVDDVLPRLPAGERVLVFTRYQASQRALERILRGDGHDARCLLGRTRTKTVEDFRQGAFRILIAGEGAGEGLNLQFCSLMINFDLPWNPMRIEQRIGRIQRIGQPRREVGVINLTVAGTIEDRVLELLEQKLELFRNLQGETEQILGEVLREDSSGTDRRGRKNRSLEAWLADMLLQDGSINLRAFRAKEREIEAAKAKIAEELRKAGAGADRLVGHGLVKHGQRKKPTPPPEELPLDFLDDLIRGPE